MPERKGHTPAEGLRPFRSTRPPADRRAWIFPIKAMGGILFLSALGLLSVETKHRYFEVLQTAEGAEAVGRLSTLAIEAANRERTDRGPTLCASAPHPVPRERSDIERSPHAHYHSSAADWTDGPPDAGFRCLRFATSSPQYYQYDYSSTGPRGVFRSTADSDIDSFFQEGEVDPVGNTVTLHSVVHRVRTEE